MSKRYDMTRSRRFTWIGMVVGMMLVCVSSVWAQDETSPEFDVNAVSVRSEASVDQTRLDLYVRIPYSQLSFINTADGFKATYDVTVEAHEVDDRNRLQNLVKTRIWERTVTVPLFASTQSNELSDYSTQSIEVAPGRYLLTFQLEDRNTNEAYVQEVPVSVRDLGGEVAISDLILIKEFDEETNTIVPRVSNRVGTDQFGVELFYEIYADQPREVQVKRDVIRTRKGSGPPLAEAMLDDSEEATLDGALTYTNEAFTELKAGRNQTVVEIPLEDVKVGEYVVRVRVEDTQGRLLGMAEKALVAQWTGLAEHIDDIDDAIAQLQYIAKGRQIRHIKEGQTKDERLKRFKEFWEKRDPTPGTKRNERMEEYYYRIAYANRQYGSVTDGWKTDRGHVMILFGEPDHIERHPYNFNVKPYEVWIYDRIGRQFIFVDETGFGDYELLVPFWDERTRIR